MENPSVKKLNFFSGPMGVNMFRDCSVDQITFNWKDVAVM